MSRKSIYIGLWGLACAGIVLGMAWQQPTSGAHDDAEPRSADVTELMHEKLTSSQLILIGLINRDLPVVEEAGEELASLAKSAVWLEATNDPVYAHFNAEFQRLSERIVRMARSENPDGAAYAYQNLTTTCISCHEHVRDVTRLTREDDE